MPTTTGKKMATAKTRKLLSPAKKIEGWRDYKSGGGSVRSLAIKYGCSKSTISNIIKEPEPYLPVALPDPPEVKESLKKSIRKKEEKNFFSPLPGESLKKNSDKICPSAELNSTVQKTSIIFDPLEFRENKLEEIAIDIQSSRISGRTSIIPQLHRLHLSVHDEVVQLKDARDGVEDGMDQDALVATIVGTVSKLPPMIRQSIQDQLENLETGRIISFPQVNSDEEIV
jgi:hypothetical protein